MFFIYCSTREKQITKALLKIIDKFQRHEIL